MTQPKNKEYQHKKHLVYFASIALTLMILCSAIYLQLTFMFYGRALLITQSRLGVVFFYFVFFSLYSLIFTFPLSFYSGFTLEHQYQLSNQKFGGWLWDWTKRQSLGFGISAPLILLLYFLIWTFPHAWWLLAWLGYAVFSLVLGKLFPVLIVPLFYKYSPIADQQLKKKIEALADRFGLKIQNVYSLNLSKTTKKANAAFTGLGKTKRVILGDTLIGSFTHDEIETVLAHEIGHFKNHDIWKQFAFGTLFSLVGFWFAFHLLNHFSYQLHYDGAGDVRSFPLFSLIFFLFSLVMSPAANTFSRFAERKADRFALDATRDKPSFISAMQKLSDMNLADPDPNPIVEFVLYDHHSIGKRIKMAERYLFSS